MAGPSRKLVGRRDTGIAARRCHDQRSDGSSPRAASRLADDGARELRAASGGRWSEQGRLTPRESCARARRGRPLVAAETAPIVRCGPSPSSRRPRADIPEGSVPISSFSCPALRSVQRRGSHRGRRPAVRRHLPGAAWPPDRPPSGQRRASRSAGRGDRRRRGRPLPTGRADPRGLALRRHPAQGSAPVDLRLRADVSRAGHGPRAHPARLLRQASSRGVRGGRWRAAATSAR